MHKFKENVERENQEITNDLETLLNELKVKPGYSSRKFKSMYSELNYWKVSKKSLKNAIEIAEKSLKKDCTIFQHVGIFIYLHNHFRSGSNLKKNFSV